LSTEAKRRSYRGSWTTAGRTERGSKVTYISFEWSPFHSPEDGEEGGRPEARGIERFVEGVVAK